MHTTPQIKDISEMDIEKLKEMYRDSFDKAFSAFKAEYEKLYGIPLVTDNLGTITPFRGEKAKQERTFDQVIAKMHNTLDYRVLENDLWMFKGIGGAPQTSKGWSSTLPDNPTLEQAIEAAADLKQYCLPDLLKLRENAVQYYREDRKTITPEKYEFIRAWCRDDFKEYVDWCEKTETLQKEIFSVLKKTQFHKTRLEKEVGRVQKKYGFTQKETEQKKKQCKKGAPLKTEEVNEELREKYPSHFNDLKLYHAIIQTEQSLKRIDNKIRKMCGGEPQEILPSTFKHTFERALKQKAEPYLMQYHINLEVLIAEIKPDLTFCEGRKGIKYAVLTNLPDQAKPLLSTLCSGSTPFDYNAERISFPFDGKFSEYNVLLHTPVDPKKNKFFKIMHTLDPRRTLNVEYWGAYDDMHEPTSVSGIASTEGHGPSPLSKTLLREIKSFFNAKAKEYPDNLTIKYIEKTIER